MINYENLTAADVERMCKTPQGRAEAEAALAELEAHVTGLIRHAEEGARLVAIIKAGLRGLH